MQTRLGTRTARVAVEWFAVISNASSSRASAAPRWAALSPFLSRASRRTNHAGPQIRSGRRPSVSQDARSRVSLRGVAIEGLDCQRVDR
jgi:hypothetical protein